jgi:pimeloyl-ACP methyl ester carboxylesterase
LAHSENYEYVKIKEGSAELCGDLDIPVEPIGVVIFAHGSGSSRLSPRNRFVAGVLRDAGLATLLFDLLTPEEETYRSCVFDIFTLSQRLLAATSLISHNHSTKNLRIGYFGASTGAAAAMRASVDSNERISAIVSRGGRPDLATDAVPRVRAPTLLIVGGDDEEVLDLNEQAFEKMNCEKELKVVEGATHLFEEEGKLEEVAQLATEWFVKHFRH